MRRRIVLLLVAPLLLAAPAMAQTKSSVFGSEHDIAGLGGGCKSCHAPHQGSAAGEVLLWARAFPSTGTFGVYTTPTMDSIPTEVGGAYSATNPPTGVKQYTVLCLSCHDGITTPSIIGATSGAAIGNPTNSDGLRNDHPINMAYNATADAGLEPLATVLATSIRLFHDGTNQTVQCASCHNVHDDTLSPFLRVANTNAKAGLCTTCHK